MSTFDSPIARCDAIHEMVLIDETQRECARKHGCPRSCVCPLRAYFTATSGLADDEIPVPPNRRRPSRRQSPR